MSSYAHLIRQVDLIPLDTLDVNVTIIGAGAIGSWVALALAKMGVENITVYDHDMVSIENMNCQFYPRSAIGQPKVEALAKMVDDFTGVKINAKPAKYESGVFSGVVISAVDSMAVRRLIWEQHKNIAPFTRYIIDPRMAAEDGLMYVMNPMSDKDQKTYEKTLYSDDNAVQERCTAKATVYTSNMISGLVCKAVKDIITNSDYPRTVQWSIKENHLMAWKGAVNG